MGRASEAREYSCTGAQPTHLLLLVSHVPAAARAADKTLHPVHPMVDLLDLVAHLLIIQFKVAEDGQPLPCKLCGRNKAEAHLFP